MSAEVDAEMNALDHELRAISSLACTARIAVQQLDGMPRTRKRNYKRQLGVVARYLTEASAPAGNGPEAEEAEAECISQEAA